ncbi:MAG TPA: TetR/AcrR family transcriptional regulator [Leptospiraceae bacterium]|nr:TetR/AcrR family transcriptional regulator [Leptospiraceae bacterium]HMW04120.1 TetR/AcrR family transcriptional regulator [Leptospiraceae bacterium]HMX30813.1 TetR/AcrR family transcriptional regulator [Leptospiraceae bacterium]HMY30113.1 TetR/AcrR family transcriptional regulator [Leptospiraceae bacterium]HMZ65449.1 TetR/AcrR family transcriptional regulator [Leptospiraceae bacterium]
MPKIVNHAEYREEILEKCFVLFARSGFQGITMREIGKQLDISTGTLYHYFPSKEEIFRQMIIQLSRKQVVILTEQFSKTKSFEERISKLFRFVSQNEEFFQNVLFLIIDYYRQSGLKDPEFFIRDMAAFYRKAIGELVGFGDSPASGAMFTFCLGLVLQSMIQSEGKEREEVFLLIKQMIDSFIASMSAIATQNNN